MPLPSFQDTIIDIYPFLNNKNDVGLLERISVSLNWVPLIHQRRLQAYTVLAAYTANMSNAVRRTVEKDLLEYGDANFVCNAMANAVVGDNIQIVCVDDPDREEWFAKWAKDELFFPKLIANEYKASNIGDCVYRLNYSKYKGRTEVATLDPGFWFPYHLGTKDEKHYLGWEVENEDTGTYEVYLEEYTRNSQGGGGTSNNISLTAGYYSRGSGKDVTDLQLLRYATDDEGTELNHCDLGIDTFPIIYIPNIWREGFDYGESDLTAVCRILDQLANTYTDEAKNSYFMGLVQMYVEKETFDSIQIDKDGNKAVVIGENKIIPGKAGIVDNSFINEGLMKYQAMLEDKMMHNTMLGTIAQSSKSGDRTTGIFQIKGGALERFIWMKRLVREPKYGKLLKLVAKFETTFGDAATKKIFSKKKKNGNPVLDSQTIQFGNILPLDQTSLLANLAVVMPRLDDKDIAANIKESGLVMNHPIKKEIAPIVNTGGSGSVADASIGNKDVAGKSVVGKPKAAKTNK